MNTPAVRHILAIVILPTAALVPLPLLLVDWTDSVSIGWSLQPPPDALLC
jgi:hypothetical protein